MRVPLTTRQQEVLDYLRAYVKEHGFPPSLRELGAGLGLASSSTVFIHLQGLEQKGWIARNPAHPRSIRILDEGPSRVKVLEALLERGVRIVEHVVSDFPQVLGPSSPWADEACEVLRGVA